MNPDIKKWERLVEKRKDAHSRQNGMAYATLCDELGSIDDERLYKEREAELKIQEILEEQERNSHYASFLEEAESLTYFGRFNAEVARVLLERFFPGQFGDNGKQFKNLPNINSIYDCSDEKVYGIFNGFYNSRLKRKR